MLYSLFFFATLSAFDGYNRLYLPDCKPGPIASALEEQILDVAITEREMG
jgi:hypothetical protein